MPVLRYQIRNEYGLADPDLYCAADPEDPEALLEGVAMAGLVGVLRQLGDLAEFAAEIFHELHEEVMATAARGHGLMLRVQQLEAEFPSIEKAFLSQTNYSHLAYNEGIHWHANIRSDHNLITQGDMPRFVLDSYEECRGPPRLFMLDKFDVAGVGACLKRYSDPSFFKTELASSGIMEANIQKEKKARKIKKKLPRWRNEVVDTSLSPYVKSNLQPESSGQVPEKNPIRRVKLKSRHSSGDTSTIRSYMESLLEVPSPEEKVLWENSKRQPRKIIDSGESVPEVHEIVIDNSDNFPSFREGNHTQPPSKQITLLDTNERENQNINSEEFFETIHEPLNKVENMCSVFQIVEEKEMLLNSLNKTENSNDSHRSSEAENNATVLKDVHQKKVLAEAECITEGFTDEYRSDDIGSEVENYMDALNTMDSEIETDSESRAKSDPGFLSMDSRRVLSDSKKMQSQSSETDSFEESTATFRSKNILNKEIPWHSNQCSKTAAQSPLQDMINTDMPANSEICMSETHNNSSADLQRNIEAESSLRLLSDSLCSARVSDVPNFSPAIGEARSGSCLTDSISSPIHMQPQESFDESKSMTSDSSEIPSYVKSQHRVAEHLDDNLPCMTITYVASQFDGLSLGIGDIPGAIDPAQPEELISEHTANAIDMPYNVSQECDERDPKQCSAGHVENLLLQEQQSREQDAETCSTRSLSPTTCVIIPGVRSMLQPDGLAPETECLVQPEDLDAEIYPGSERITREISKKLDGSSSGSHVPKKSHPTENEELEDRADELDMFDHLPSTQKRIILENIPAGHVRDSPPSLAVSIAESEVLTEQNTVACSGESISSTTNASSPLPHDIIIQPAGVDGEMERFVPSGEELACSGSAEDIENGDDIISGKIMFHNILPVGFELLSDEELHDYCNVESEECFPSSDGKNTYPDNMQLQSNCKSTDTTHPVSDNFGLPSGSTVSSFHQDELQVDRPMQFVDSLTENASTETVVDYNGISVYSRDAPDDADPNQHSLDINKASNQTTATAFHSESNLNKSLIPQDENLPLSAPEATSSEATIVDLSDSSNAILSSGVWHSMPSGHMETDTNPIINEDCQIYSLPSEQDLSSKAFQPCTWESVEQDTSSCIHPTMPDEEFLNDTSSFIHPAMPDKAFFKDTSSFIHSTMLDEAFSNVQPDDELNMISSDQEGQLLVQSDLQSEIAQSVKQDNTQNNCVECDKQSESGPEREVNVMASDGRICELDLPSSSTGILLQLHPEASVPSECSSVDTVNSLTPNVCTTTAGLPLFADFGLALTESTPHQFSEPSISSCEVPSLQLEDIQEAPPLPPLPPLEWRMGKLRLGSIVSDGNSIQPLSGTILMSESSNVDDIYAHGLVIAKEEMLQPSGVFVPLLSLEEGKFQKPLLSLKNERLQPLKLSELPPIVDSTGYHNGTEREMGYPLSPSSLISPIEDGQHVYSHNAFWGKTFQSSNPFAPSDLLKEQNTQGYHQVDKIQPLEDMSPELGQLLPAFEVERFRHGNPNTERNLIQSIDPFLVEPPAVGEKYQYNFRVCEGENLQHLNLSGPISTRDPRTRQHDFMSSWGKYPYIPDDGVLPTVEDVKPNGKFPSIRNLPRHPLIDAVAAHDKTKLRKVSELVQPSTKRKADERDTLLEQIRNKSFNLKPASATRPYINGPRTNLKVAAILEKANTIRQACMGSDDDDDGDSWSDS